MPAVITYSNPDGNLAAGIADGLAKELDRRQRLTDELTMRNQAHQMQMDLQHQHQQAMFAQAQQIQAQSQAFQQAQSQQQMGFTVGRDQFHAAQQDQHFKMQQEATQAAEARRAAIEQASPLYQARLSETTARANQIAGQSEREAAAAAAKHQEQQTQTNAATAGLAKLREAIAASNRPDKSDLLAEVDGRMTMLQAGGKPSGDMFNMPNAPREQRPLSLGLDAKNRAAAIRSSPDVATAWLTLTNIERNDFATPDEKAAARDAYHAAYADAEAKMTGVAPATPPPAASAPTAAPDPKQIITLPSGYKIAYADLAAATAKAMKTHAAEWPTATMQQRQTWTAQAHAGHQ